MSSYIDEWGYRIIENPEDTSHAKFKGFCTKCHHTYWPGELVEKVVRWDSRKKKNCPFGFKHIDCPSALVDKTPRTLNPKFETMYSGLDKAKLKKKVKKALLSQSHG